VSAGEISGRKVCKISMRDCNVARSSSEGGEVAAGFEVARKKPPEGRGRTSGKNAIHFETDVSEYFVCLAGI
jgi:hypothetical protein